MFLYFTPIKLNELLSIKINDFDNNFEFINISSYEVSLNRDIVKLLKDYNDKYEYYIKYLNKYYSNKNQDKDWFKYIRREFNKYNSTPLMPDIEIDEWGKKMIENIPDQSIYDYFDLLGGSKYDRLKFKLLEYKYKLRAQR